MKTVFIYSISTLEDPNNIKYIGKTNNSIDKRLDRHLQAYYLKEDTYKARWLKKEINNGNTPIINIVDVVPETEWPFWETYWIAQFKTWGFKLTNTTIGGDGIKLTKEIVLKRNKTRFEASTKKLHKEIKNLNIIKTNNIWQGERCCPKCKEILRYKHKNRSNCMAKIRKAIKYKHTCLKCRNCIENLGIYNLSGNKKNKPSKTKQNKNREEIIMFLRNVALKKKVLMLSLSEEVLKVFESIREAERVTKIHRKHISSCCSGKPHCLTAGGFKWKFA